MFKIEMKNEYGDWDCDWSGSELPVYGTENEAVDAVNCLMETAGTGHENCDPDDYRIIEIS